MLKHLTIKNYALIRHLEMQPSAHLNVITGETGAGKSIMLGAIGLLMGNRADTKVLWDQNEKCVTEGVFDIKPYRLKDLFDSFDLDYAEQTVIRREINPGGKSRAFINDTPVTLDVLKTIGSLLLDVHSQHETLQLGNQQFQLLLIDSYASNYEVKEKYEAYWNTYTTAKREYGELSSQAEQLKGEADYINFQLDELVKADLKGNEQTELESELKIIDHSEDIKIKLQQITELGIRSEYSTQSSLSEIRNLLQSIATYSNNFEALFQRIESVRIEFDDVLDELEKAEANVEIDPERALFIKDRLSTIYRLQKKHRVNEIAELLNIQEELEKRASITSNVDDALSKAQTAMSKAYQDVVKQAKLLTASRKKASAPLCQAVTSLLEELGIPNATLLVDHKETEPGVSGADQIEILFSANKGIPARPLAHVASGGEFSRLMFSVKYVMAEKTSIPTLILDEIDNGISGEIAIKLGNLMQEMSVKHQLISITHLPQIAGKGHAHYYVYKDNSSTKTTSNVQLLTEEERIQEIAKMIGGEKPSAAALEGARELLR